MRKILYYILPILIWSGSHAQIPYEMFSIQQIDIEFQVQNWDEILDSYIAADSEEMLIATVSINGTIFDSVGVKYKGNSTYNANNAKNPLNIQLDYVKKQNYMGYETFKLSNGKNDPSFIREVLSYEIVRKYMDAPLSCYAKVFINGAEYGIFSSSEAINGDFTKDRFDAKDRVRIKCNPVAVQSGNGCSLEFLGTDSANYYSQYDLKSDSGWFKLLELINVLNFDQQNIENILDVDRAIWMLAFNNVTANLDSYTGPFRQNFYLLEDNYGRINPVIWDLNEGLGGFERINTSGPPAPPNLDDLKTLDPFIREGDSSFPLLNLIYNNARYRKMYLAHCRTMLDENFSNSWYSEKADSLQDFIGMEVQNDPNAFYSYDEFILNLTSTHTAGGFPPQQTIGVTELMEARVQYLNSLSDFQKLQPTITDINVPDTVHPFDTITVKCSISNGNYAYIAYRHNKFSWFNKVEMYDDGLHNDELAGDSIWAADIIVDESKTHFYIYTENSDAGAFFPARAEHEFYTITSVNDPLLEGTVVINEVMASNSTTAKDQSGSYDDWIELFNNTPDAIDLSGYYLTDDLDNLTKWSFPDTSIQAGSYLIIWADNDITEQGLHASFKLSASGEILALVNSNYQISDSVSFGLQNTDIALARNPNGTGSFVNQSATFYFNNELQSVSELNEFNCRIYPNPAKDYIMVHNNRSQFALEIYSITGVKVFSEFIAENERIINLRTFPTGIYILIVDSHPYKFIKTE